MFYTEEQKEWLKREYAHFRNEVEFEQRFYIAFGVHRAPRSLSVYCRNCLKAKRQSKREYTDEEIQWLRENYPILGRPTLGIEFEKQFGRKKSAHTLRGYCSHTLGLRVDRERQEAVWDSLTLPIGSIRPRKRGQFMIKTEQGWKELTHSLLDNIPKGYNIFHLDGNKQNNDLDNLIILPQSTFIGLKGFSMWSANKEITQAAATWYELYKTLNLTPGDISKIEKGFNLYGRI